MIYDSRTALPADFAMAIHSICRSAARVAAFAAVMVLLLQASCPAQFMPSTAAQMQNTTRAACHEPVPLAPAAPASEHQCCNGAHDPEALLSGLQALPVPSVATAAADETHFRCALMSNCWDSISASVFRPPGPFPLRI
jgi:hypothetical protein